MTQKKQLCLTHFKNDSSGWKGRKTVYNKHVNSESPGILSKIPHCLRPTKKPLSQEATDCLSLWSTVRDSRDSTVSHVLFTVTGSGKNLNQAPQPSIKWLTRSRHLIYPPFLPSKLPSEEALCHQEGHVEAGSSHTTPQLRRRGLCIEIWENCSWHSIVTRFFPSS